MIFSSWAGTVGHERLSLKAPVKKISALMCLLHKKTKPGYTPLTMILDYFVESYIQVSFLSL